MDDILSEAERPNNTQNYYYNPLVSIITVVKNDAEHVDLCIESVMRQSYAHIEHIFIDGGSLDGTLEILSSYNAKYPTKLRYLSEPDNSPAEAANKGIRLAKGAILGFIGSQDTYVKDAVRKIVEFYRANPDAYFVFGDCNLIDEKGEFYRKVQPADFNLAKILNVNCHIPGTSTFYRREVIDKIGRFDTAEVALACDIDFLIRASKEFKIHRINDVLSNWKYHPVSFSGKEWVKHKMLAKSLYILNRKYHGSIFSWQCLRYYVTQMIDGLRPVLHPLYPFMERIINKYRYKR